MVPAYYDVALKFKGTRDERSIEMLDAIVQSRVFDFGYVYGGWGCVFWIQYMMEQKSKDITSYYERISPPTKKRWRRYSRHLTNTPPIDHTTAKRHFQANF